MSGNLLSLTGAVVRLAPSRREIRKAARRRVLLAMVALAVMPPVVALTLHLAARGVVVIEAAWEGGAR